MTDAQGCEQLAEGRCAANARPAAISHTLDVILVAQGPRCATMPHNISG